MIAMADTCDILQSSAESINLLFSPARKYLFYAPFNDSSGQILSVGGVVDTINDPGVAGTDSVTSDLTGTGFIVVAGGRECA